MAMKLLGKPDRGKQVDQLLANLSALRGVTAAAIVDSDGFVTHIRRDFEIDTDALGAGVQIIHGSARRAAGHVSQGESNVVLCENEDGLILLAGFGEGFLLAIVADKSAMLGAVRFEVKETVKELGKLF